jgi:NIPSNAP
MIFKNPIKITLYHAIILAIMSINAIQAKPKREFYEIKIYTIKTSEQATRVENYLKDAYIPAMHRLGVKTIGVFKPVAADTASFGKLIYVLTPIKALDDLLNLPKKLNSDGNYLISGKDYIDAEYKNPPYTRFESIVIQAFTDAPMLNLPLLTGAKSDRIYELRSYEGHTEKIYQNKVKMFNTGGEVTLFKRLNFNAVFYGEVIAGSHMPNLMYMTTFENKADRDTHWKAFSASPEWSKLKADPEYQNNVSKNEQKFLFPTDYSDL